MTKYVAEYRISEIDLVFSDDDYYSDDDNIGELQMRGNWVD